TSIARGRFFPPGSRPPGTHLLSGTDGPRNLAAPVGAPPRSNRPESGGGFFKKSFPRAFLGRGRRPEDPGDLFPPGRQRERGRPPLASPSQYPSVPAGSAETGDRSGCPPIRGWGGDVPGPVVEHQGAEVAACAD